MPPVTLNRREPDYVRKSCKDCDGHVKLHYRLADGGLKCKACADRKSISDVFTAWVTRAAA